MEPWYKVAIPRKEVAEKANTFKGVTEFLDETGLTSAPKADQALSIKSDISQILDDLGLSGKVRIEEKIL